LYAYFGLVFALCGLFAPWIHFDVPSQVRDQLALNGSSLDYELYQQYPQLFYSRDRYLWTYVGVETCFTGAVCDRFSGCSKEDRTVKVTCTGQGGNQNDSCVFQVPQCLTEYELFGAVRNLFIASLALGFITPFLAGITVAADRLCCTLVSMSFIVIQDLLMVMTIVLFFVSDATEANTTLVGHYGFVKTHPMLSVTRKSYGGGFWMTTAILAFYILSTWLLVIACMSKCFHENKIRCSDCWRRRRRQQQLVPVAPAPVAVALTAAAKLVPEATVPIAPRQDPAPAALRVFHVELPGQNDGEQAVVKLVTLHDVVYGSAISSDNIFIA
jgi:hypothetical protein